MVAAERWVEPEPEPGRAVREMMTREVQENWEDKPVGGISEALGSRWWVRM